MGGAQKLDCVCFESLVIWKKMNTDIEGIQILGLHYACYEN